MSWLWSSRASRRHAEERVETTPPQVARVLIDANPEISWVDEQEQQGTLLDAADPGRAPVSLADMPNEDVLPNNGRPKGNPAFSEALFVELMRAEQFGRVFALLAPDCQAAWQTEDRFVAAQSDSPLHVLRNIDVVDLRYRQHWSEPHTGTVYEHAAELDVEYTLQVGGRTNVMKRTVHLVGCDGKWRSVYFPPSAPQS